MPAGGNNTFDEDELESRLSEIESGSNQLQYAAGSRSWTQWFRNFSNPSQAWMETVGFGTVAYYGKKAAWQLAQLPPDPFFCFLILPYAINEMTEALATMQGAENPDQDGDGFDTRSYIVEFPHMTRREQLARGILQTMTSGFLLEGVGEGLIKHFLKPDLALTLGPKFWSLPGRLCIHFIGKVILDCCDYIKLWNSNEDMHSSFGMSPYDRERALCSITVNLITNILAATAFGLLAYGNPLGFVFLGAHAALRTWQNFHRPIIWARETYENSSCLGGSSPSYSHKSS